MRSQQLEINQIREKFDKELNEQNKTRQHWKKEVKKLRLRPVPGEELPELQEIPDEELDTLDKKKLSYELNLLEERLGNMKVNFGAIEEYRSKEELYLRRVEELEKVSRRKEKQRKNHEEMRKLRLNEFMEVKDSLKEIISKVDFLGRKEIFVALQSKKLVTMHVFLRNTVGTYYNGSQYNMERNLL